MKRLFYFLLGGMTALIARPYLRQAARASLKGAVRLQHELGTRVAELREELEDVNAEVSHERQAKTDAAEAR